MADKENSSKGASAKGIIKNMEYLIRLLHKEWERSGRTTVEAVIKNSDLPSVSKRTAAAIMEKQVHLETAEMTFKQGMKLSRENFILLRLARKVEKADRRAAKNGDDAEICIELDREEYRLFAKILKIQELPV